MMPGPSGVALVLAANAALLVAAFATLVYLSRKLGDTGTSAEEWYEETVSLAREVQQATAADGRSIDRDRVQRRVVPLATRLKSHARRAPDGVDDQLVRAVHELGVDCYRVGMEHTERRAARTGVFIEEWLQELGHAATELEEDASAQL